MFSSYEDADQILQIGVPVTFTYNIGQLIDTNWPSTVDDYIKNTLAAYGTVTKVSRPIFSGRYVITVTPTESMTPEVWKNLVLDIMHNEGYSNASFEVMDGGKLSSDPGGVQGLVQGGVNIIATDVISPLAQGAKNALDSAIKPLSPYLWAAGGIAVLLAGSYVYAIWPKTQRS